MAEYEVLTEKGVGYTINGGEVQYWIKGEKIRQSDIDNKLITVGGLKTLEKRGDVAELSDEKELEEASNKKMPKGSKKADSDAEGAEDAQ